MDYLFPFKKIADLFPRSNILNPLLIVFAIVGIVLSISLHTKAQFGTLFFVVLTLVFFAIPLWIVYFKLLKTQAEELRSEEYLLQVRVKSEKNKKGTLQYIEHKIPNEATQESNESLLDTEDIEDMDTIDQEGDF